MAHLGIVSPIYQAEACISELCRRIVAAAGAVTQDFEIVLVDDRSTDGSWSAIEQEAFRDSRIRGIRLSRNFGQHHAITAGLDKVDADWVVVMDCDLQDPPEAIPLLYAKAQEGFEIVVAEFQERAESGVRQLRSRIFWRSLAWIAGTSFDYRTGNFRIMSRNVVGNFRQFREQLRILGGITSLMGFTTATVPVKRETRLSGRSSYTVSKLVSSALNAAVAYSDKPLRFSVTFGLVLAALAVAFGVLGLLLRLMGVIEVPGWAGIIAAVLFLSGMILTNLGILGIYIGRVFDEAKRRPLYIIESATQSVGAVPTQVSKCILASRVIWITGLSGAGKSTLGLELTRQFRELNVPVIMLDGDELREVFGAVTPARNDHDRESRRYLAMKYAQLCKVCAQEDITVVIGTISLFREVHEWNRSHLPNYFEVYLRTSLAELRRRDPKGIYRRFDTGEIANVAGLDIPVDEPIHPDLIVDSTLRIPVEKTAREIIHLLGSEE